MRKYVLLFLSILIMVSILTVDSMAATTTGTSGKHTYVLSYVDSDQGLGAGIFYTIDFTVTITNQYQFNTSPMANPTWIWKSTSCIVKGSATNKKPTYAPDVYVMANQEATYESKDGTSWKQTLTLSPNTAIAYAQSGATTKGTYPISVTGYAVCWSSASASNTGKIAAKANFKK